MNRSANDTMVGHQCFSASCLLSSPSTYFVILLLFLLFVASLVGNVLILVLLSKDHQLRGRSSPSHISLAVADLLATIFWLPFLIIDIFIVDKWIFGAALCKIVSFFQVLSVASSSLNLCIVTAECFAAVWFPFFLKVLPRKRTILISSCLIVWSIAFIDGVMYIQYRELKPYEGNEYCSETFPDKLTRKIFVYLNQCLFSFGPLIAITVLNLLCIYRLCQSSNTLGCRRRHSKGGTHTRSATKKIVTISLIFVICRSPYHIFEMAMFSGGHELISPRIFLIVYTIVVGLYFFSATTHPVLFGLMSVYYREAFMRSCPCIAAQSYRRSSTSKSGQTTKILETMF